MRRAHRDRLQLFGGHLARTRPALAVAEADATVARAYLALFRERSALLFAWSTKMLEAIEYERALLADVRPLGFVFDTSELSAAALRATVPFHNM